MDSRGLFIYSLVGVDGFRRLCQCPLKGIGGPGAPHVMHFCRRVDAGLLLQREATMFELRLALVRPLCA